MESGGLDGFTLTGSALVHPGAHIGTNVTMDGPVVIYEGCTVKANAYLREGVVLDPGTAVGPNVEVKSSIVAGDSALSYLNYVGNSIVGTDVNLEAGVVIANHFNESPGKTMAVRFEVSRHDTGVTKFGAIVGDACKVGANAVLSPGTILKP